MSNSLPPMPSRVMECACVHFDRFVCANERYCRVPGRSREEFDPCDCGCHDDYDDDEDEEALAEKERVAA